MKKGATPRRPGQPLVVLFAVLAGWVALRITVWNVALAFQPGAVSLAAALPAKAPASVLSARPAHAIVASFPVRAGMDGTGAGLRAPSVVPPASAPSPMPAFLDMGPVPQAPSAVAPLPQPLSASGGHAALMPAHQMLLMAGLGYLDLPDSVQSALHGASASPRAVPPTSPAVPAGERRWSGDGWLLLRRGAGAAALASGASSYGGSQFGAVLRYRLAPGSALRPQAYLHVAGAVDAPTRDRQAALGLAVRPFVRLPMAALAELRVQQGSGAAMARPAFMLVSEVPPLPLPLGAQGDVYAQAGWVGGRDATAFFDLQAVADRSLLRVPSGHDLRAGAGVWSGGQRGAARLDIGPRISLRSHLGAAPARLALDWRWRVAGQAEPGSGPALTLAAGF